jgi:hypothetical protein
MTHDVTRLPWTTTATMLEKIVERTWGHARSSPSPWLRAIQWLPNFKVSKVDKYEPKQDPGGWLVVYTIVARAAREMEDILQRTCPSFSDKMRCSGSGTFLAIASMTGTTSTTGLSRISNPFSMNRRSPRTSNASSAKVMSPSSHSQSIFKL